MHPRAPVLLVALLQREGVHDELRVGLGVVREEGREVDGPRIVGVARRLLAVDLAVVAQSVDVLKGVRDRLADLGERFSETEITNRDGIFTIRLGYLQHPCYFGFSVKKSGISHNYF